MSQLDWCKKEDSPSPPPGECGGPGLRACCRCLPCCQPNRPIRILASLSQDLSTVKHPNIWFADLQMVLL